jgi:enoyl-CoA hydratase/carnithine racemase
MSERVRIDVQNGIADVRLNRPQKMNALDMPMFEALVATGRELAQHRSVRAVVLSGEGRAFCSGLDFRSFASLSEGDGGSLGLMCTDDTAPANFAQSAAWVLHDLPMPVIAAVHGVAYGGGLQIALGADIRIVAPRARLSVMEVKWGVVPDMGGPQLLRHLVRLDVAKELTYTASIVSGCEAVELGLATRVSEDPRVAALELATEISSKSPHAVRAAKNLLNQVSVATVGEGLALEAKTQGTLIRMPNQIEAVMANFEKRNPVFADVD